jgi:hypothetical protein
VRVLDDVSDIDAVIVAIGNDDTAAADDLVPDNEDDSEGGIEDRDVVQDPVEVEPAI